MATKLVGPYLRLVSGCALILDYVLAIAISIASGVDALASFLPLGFQPYKLWAEAFFIALLIVMNLRGLKEAIQILLPISLGFVATHLVLIVYGIVAHAWNLPQLVPRTLLEAREQGGGTYTGLEAVSNNVNLLAESRSRCPARPRGLADGDPADESLVRLKNPHGSVASSRRTGVLSSRSAAATMRLGLRILCGAR